MKAHYGLPLVWLTALAGCATSQSSSPDYARYADEQLMIEAKRPGDSESDIRKRTAAQKEIDWRKRAGTFGHSPVISGYVEQLAPPKSAQRMLDTPTPMNQPTQDVNPSADIQTEKPVPTFAELVVYTGPLRHFIKKSFGHVAIMDDGSVWECSDPVNLTFLDGDAVRLTTVQEKPLMMYKITLDNPISESALLLRKNSTSNSVLAWFHGFVVTDTYVRETFRGRFGELVFTFDNGQIWKQAATGNHFVDANHPEVIVFKFGPFHYLLVEGQSEKIEVEWMK